MTQYPVPIEPDSMFAGLRWPAILLAAVLDNLLSMVVIVPIMFFFAGADALSGDEELANRAFDQARASIEFLTAALVVGCAITALAGFWAASRAGALHVRHGGWTAVASVTMAFLILLIPGMNDGADTPLWYDALGLVLVVPAGMFGGWCAAAVGARAA